MMKKPSKTPAMEEAAAAAVEHMTKLATCVAEIENLKKGVTGISGRVEVFEKESRDNFSRLFDKLERATAPKETNWGVIFAGCGVLVAVLTAIAGGGLTLILALAAWANAYFGDLISKADAKADKAIEVHGQYGETLNSVRDSLANINAEVSAGAKDRERLASKIDSLERRMEDRTP